MNTTRNTIRSVALFAFVAASATIATTSTFAVPAYDGLWSVSIVTEKGTCDRGYRYPIRISNGVLANAGDVAVNIAGKVMPTGAITVVVSAAGKSANGSGRLSGNLGEVLQKLIDHLLNDSIGSNIYMFCSWVG
jgi:hypothetical protein